MKQAIVEKGVYRHYKGKNYRVIDVVKHSETLEDLVLYDCLYDNETSKTWVRPVDNFLSEVEIDGSSKRRFEYIGDAPEPFAQK